MSDFQRPWRPGLGNETDIQQAGKFPDDITLNCTFPLKGKATKLLDDKEAKQAGCKDTLQELENFGKLKTIVEHIACNRLKTIIMLHNPYPKQKDAFKELKQMLAAQDWATIVLDNSEKAYLSEGKGAQYEQIAKDQAQSKFNKPANCLGEQVRVALLSAEKHSEGTSFQEVRQIILADLSAKHEPVKWANVAQRIGRALRMCSHKLAASDPKCQTAAQKSGTQCADRSKEGRGVTCQPNLSNDSDASAALGGNPAAPPVVEVHICIAQMPRDAQAIRGIQVGGKFPFQAINAKCLALMIGQRTIDEEKWESVVANKEKYDAVTNEIEASSIEAALPTEVHRRAPG